LRRPPSRSRHSMDDPLLQQPIVACDQEIEGLLGEFDPRVDPDKRPLPPDRKRSRSGKKRRKKNGNPNPNYDLRTEAYKPMGNHLRRMKAKLEPAAASTATAHKIAVI
jgi:hypothetical protein